MIRRTSLFLNYFAGPGVWWHSIQLLASRSRRFPSVDITPEPVQNGLIAWAYDPASAVNTSPITAGQIILVRMQAAITASATAVSFIIGNIPAGTSNVYVGIYDDGGALLGASTEQSALLNSSPSRFSPSLESPVQLSAGETYFAALLVGGGQTLPTIGRASSIPGATTNVGSPRVRTYGSGLTALPGGIGQSPDQVSGTAYYASIGWIGN